MIRLFSVILALSCNAASFASTLIVESGDAARIYDNTLANYYPSTVHIFTVRDFIYDAYDNRKDTITAILTAKKYDNLVVLGFDDVPASSNLTVIPLFSRVDNYSTQIKRIVQAFEPKSAIHVVCDTYCPTQLGEVHRIKTQLHLKILLSELEHKENIVIINLLPSLYDSDTEHFIFGDTISKMFMQNSKHLEFSIFRPDSNTAVSLWIEPKNIVSHSDKMTVEVNLQRITVLNKQNEIFEAVKSEELKIR